VKAPETANVEAKFPEMVMVLAALFATPVPPFAGEIAPVISAAASDAIITFVPLPRKYAPLVTAPAKAFIASCAVVWPDPPLPSGKVPVTPVVKGNPVALVNVPDWGVPKIGVTKVGLVAKTLFPLPVLVTLTICLLAFSASDVDAVNAESVSVPL